MRGLVMPWLRFEKTSQAAAVTVPPGAVERGSDDAQSISTLMARMTIASCWNRSSRSAR